MNSKVIPKQTILCSLYKNMLIESTVLPYNATTVMMVTVRYHARDNTASTKAICLMGLCASNVLDHDDLGWTVVNIRDPGSVVYT